MHIQNHNTGIIVSWLKKNFTRMNAVKSYIHREKLLKSRGVSHYVFNERGYVLIIVLITTTLLITITTDFIIASQTNIGYMRKFSKKLKAGYLAKSGIELCKSLLEADKNGEAGSIFPGVNSDKNIDSYHDLWAKEFPEVPIDEGSIKVSITDENSKINLSVLATEFVDKTTYYGITQRFFVNMGLLMDFADIIIDWVDIDDSPFPYGAESSDYYMTLPIPYSAKNAAMDSIDELLMLKKMTPEIFYGMGGGGMGIEEGLVDNNMGDLSLSIEKAFNKNLRKTDSKNVTDKDKSSLINVPIGKEKSRRLSDYFRVHGRREVFNDELNKININTAPFRVISALTEKMTDDVVTEIIKRRLNFPFKSIDDIKDLIKDDSFENLKNNILSVKSIIFKITVIATVMDSAVKITAIYNRDQKKILYWSEE